METSLNQEVWQKAVELKLLTTFKVGGRAEYFVEVNTKEDLSERIIEVKDANLPITILGGGSNVLVSDDGVDGAVIKNNLKGIEYEEAGEEVLVTAMAGEDWDGLVFDTVTKGYWGLENLSHIPGSVGAVPVQNVGAYGVEVSEMIEEVEVFDLESQNFKNLSNYDCHFAYRNSIFKHQEGKKYVVVSVTLQLKKNDEPKLHYKDLKQRFDGTTPSQSEVRSAVIEIRSQKFPDWTKKGTAGSFFKNPIISKEKYEELKQDHSDLPGYEVSEDKVKVSLGWILDKVCDLKGVSKNGVGTYKNQALVIINESEADARDIDEFAKFIEAEVFNKTGIEIEREVTMLGKW